VEQHLFGIVAGLVVLACGFALSKIGSEFSFPLPFAGVLLLSASRKRNVRLPAWAQRLKQWLSVGIMLFGFVTAAIGAYKAVLDGIPPHSLPR
jgi:hypothetical protein